MAPPTKPEPDAAAGDHVAPAVDQTAAPKPEPEQPTQPEKAEQPEPDPLAQADAAAAEPGSLADPHSEEPQGPPPVLASYVCLPDVNAVELGRPDGSLCRIEAGDVHDETDPRMVDELDRHWALTRAPGH